VDYQDAAAHCGPPISFVIGRVDMNKLSPPLVAAIVIVVIIVAGLLGWKFSSTSDGISAPPPKSAANPNGYAPPPAGTTPGQGKGVVVQ
jgi:hypothetical protein